MKLDIDLLFIGAIRKGVKSPTRNSGIIEEFTWSRKRREASIIAMA